MVVEPISINTAVRFRDPLPQSVDVAIIGGGVIGVFTALYLARSGKKVLVCEKGRVAGEQSSRNWGWIRQQGRDPAELPIMMQALRLWHDVTSEAKGRTGVVTGGTSYLASTEAELTRLERWLTVAKDHGLFTERIEKSAVEEQFSGVSSGRWMGGVRTPSDARGEPWLAVPAVAELAQDSGALIREECAVRQLDGSAGRVVGIHTEDATVNCEQVVLAGGAWSSLFARAHNIALPQLSVRLTVARTAPLPQFFNGAAADEHLALRRRQDGGYTLASSDSRRFFIGPDAFRNFRTFVPLMIDNFRDTAFRPAAPSGFPDAWGTTRKLAGDQASPFERTRVLAPEPNLRHVARMQKDFGDRFPDIGKPKVLNSWAGMVDTMPDVVPVVDRVPHLDGLIVATGMSGHGFGIGPGFGRVVARMVTGQMAEHDLSRFRFERFTDGSKLRLGATI